MATEESGDLLSRAEMELEVAKGRVRDLEGFVRIYRELVGTALAMPQGAAGPSHPRPLVHAPRTGERPEVLLADSELSISEAAEKVLRHHRRAMKAREIAETMLAWEYPYKGSVHELRASVGGVLAREVREGGAFTKVATGTFGLKEWFSDPDLIEEEEEEEEDAPDTQVEQDGPEGQAGTALTHAGSLFEAVAANRPMEEAMS